MGISGLLPALKDIQVHGNISDFKGKRLAVDAYVWLHRGAFGCAEELVKGHKTTKFVDYAMYRVRLLRHHGIEPYVVFDGGPLPAKKKTESSREKSRADHLARARSLESQGRRSDARDAYTKCVDITPEMAFQLIKALRAENVDYVVAPYEADAQLCFLEREGYVDGIITEDSDLLVFGCKQVIFKLEGNGKCVSISSDKLASVRAFPMHGWTDVQFRRMAMLSGCDYLDSIPGIGLKTAHRMLRQHKTVEKVVQMVRLEGTLNVPQGYIQAFAQAELAFIHQRVFDPATKRLIPLNDFPESGLSEDDEKWVGLDLDVEVARGVARGDLHPESRQPIEDMCPDYQPQPRAGAQRASTTCKAKVAGPMDAFISSMCTVSRKIAANSAGAKASKPLPVPVGKFGAGVSRLSERSLNSIAPPPPPPPPPRSAIIKKSKFFGSNLVRQEQVVELQWESSDEAAPVEFNVDNAEAGPSRSRPPSPAVSVVSPNKCSEIEVEGEDSLVQLTSPAAPHMSSPVHSSPPAAETLTSPRAGRAPSRSRSATPCSPTRPNKHATKPDTLVPSTSQIPQLSQTPVHTPIPSSPGPLASTHTKLATSTFSNHPSSSSSGCDSGEVVTPSLPDHALRNSRTGSRSSLGKRERSNENVSVEDEARAVKAKVIAKDWRLKYAFGGLNTPTIRSRSNTKTDEAPPPTIRSRTPVPLSATVPKILSVRPANIPDTPHAPQGKRPATDIRADDPPKQVSKPSVLIPSSNLGGQGEQPSSSPASDTSSRLSRFKFTGEVDTRQMSSPSL